MMPLDKFTKEDSDKLFYWITKYNDIHCEPSVSPSYLLRFWNTEKQNLFKAFGEELILKQPIEYKKPEGAMRTEVLEKLNRMPFAKVLSDFIQSFTFEYYKQNCPQYLPRCLRDEPSSKHFIPFWESYTSEELLNVYQNINVLEHGSCFVKNEYNGNDFVLHYGPEESDTIKVVKGCKLSRALGKIAKHFNFNMKEYEEYRLEHSRILNQKKLSGELVLSIHPLDYLTMSDNACGWDSCMSWVAEGDYRQGTVEMMNSPYVVCAYLDSSEPYDIGSGYHWSNKKWRCLYIVHPNLIASIKQYPYQNEDLDDKVMNWLKELAEMQPDIYGPYYPTIEEIDCEGDFCSTKDGLKNYTIDFETNHMYNDMYDTRRAYLCRERLDLKNYTEVVYSGISECMICGKAGVNEMDSNMCVCYECADVHAIYCTCCGDRLFEDDDDIYYVNGEEPVCTYCAENRTTMCDCCRDLSWDWDSRIKYITVLDDKEDDVLNGRFCDDCLSNSDLGEIVNEKGYELKISDLTEEQLKTFEDYHYMSSAAQERLRQMSAQLIF